MPFDVAVDSPGRRILLMGNEAVARGAVEAGVQLVAGYPGTPSSEVIETLAASSSDARVEWATNEKVAFDVAVGGAVVGARSMATMKNAGLNWIMDTLMTVVYGGVRGGLTLFVADDPGAHYSSNEQDTRPVAEYARIPCLEPGNQQEAKDLTREAFDLSERIQLPVMVRSVTRLSHSSGDVTLGEIRRGRNRLAFDKHWGIPYRWNVYGPPGPVEKHRWLLERQPLVAEEVAGLGERYNRLEISGSGLGVVASGIARTYVEEALSSLGVEANLYLTVTPTPLPEDQALELLRSSETVLVVEEGEPMVERRLVELAHREGLDVRIRGKRFDPVLPAHGELTHRSVGRAVAEVAKVPFPEPEVPGSALADLVAPRSSMLCAGCPHIGTYWGLKLALLRKGGRVWIVNGDIGCYEQGGYGIAAKEVRASESEESVRYVPEAPYEIIDTNYVMGGGFGLAQGEVHAGYRDGVVVGLAGDSTFFHADLPAVVNAVVNGANALFLVMDNRWTAMTGHQPSPVTGVDARGSPSNKLDVEAVLRAMGVEHVFRADPWNLEEIQEAIERAMEVVNRGEGPAFVIADRVCTLQAMRLREYRPPTLYEVVEDRCIGCRLCIQLGCPANVFHSETKKASIDPTLCVGCGMCAQVCPTDAIVPAGEGGG